MKRKIQLAISITMIMLCLSNFTIAQVFNKTGSSQNWYGETDATGLSQDHIRKIGIGNFSGNSDEPHAFLHINSNYLLLPQNSSINGLGEVIWTDCPTGTSTADISAWRMHRNGTQLFNINNPYNTNHVFIGTVLPGNFNFFANDTQYVTIIGTNTSNKGFVGIGTNAPQYKLDVFDTINAGNEYKIGGVRALNLVPGGTNLFAGEGTGTANSSGAGNTFIGNIAGKANTTGGDNTFVGNGAGQLNTSGHENVFIGEAGDSNTTGGANVFIGIGSGKNNTIGEKNVFLGHSAGFANDSGGLNIYVGFQAGRSNISGQGNIGIGPGAGSSNTRGNYNTYVGYNTQGSGTHADSLINASALGANATVTADNCMVLGDTSNVNVGIGISEPTAKLHVINSTTDRGAYVSTNFSNTTSNTAVYGITTGSSLANVGIRGIASAVTSPTFELGNIAVKGQADGSTLNIAGVFEAGSGSCADPGILNIGVYARAAGYSFTSTSCSLSYAGLFIGSVFRTGTDNFASDANLKDSIENINSPLNTLSLLQPKSFTYKTSDFPYLNLESGRHYGLIAQQLDTLDDGIVREIVNPFIVPEMRDSTGSVISPQDTLLSVSYTELIGLLVAGINELTDTMVTTCEPTTLTDRVPKWHSTNKMLCNSLIRDDGVHVGITNSTVPGDTLNPGATLTVFTDTDTAAIQGEGVQMGGRFKGSKAGVVGFSNGNTGDFNFGVLGSSENSPGVNGGVGGLVETHTDTAINAALFGIAGNSGIGNVGAAGISESEGDTSLNIGIIGIGANSDGKNYGGRFETHNSTGVNYGIYARVEDTDSGSYAGFFEGDIYTSGVYLPSDGKLKENITDVDNALSILSRLQTKNYEYKTSEYPSMNLPQGRQYGLIAEEAERVVPELVQDIISPEHRDTIHGLPLGKVLSDEIHFKGINYMGLIPLLISGIQQQQAVIDSLSEALNTRFSEIEARLNNCCREQPQFRITGEGEGDDESINRMTIELNSMQYIVLDQNVPNPFAEQTTISYFIPDEQTTDNGQPATVSKAQIVFFDISGRIIKTADIEKVHGIITVFAPNLSSGTYSYSLLIDGKAVQTKKMVKMK